MTATETGDYISHHLKIAGRADTLFSTDAITLIHNASRGYPRAINNLAVNALTATFARNQTIVDEKAARTAISETGAESMKDMGKVMGTATKQLAGKAEGRAISEMVKKLLS